MNPDSNRIEKVMQVEQAQTQVGVQLGAKRDTDGLMKVDGCSRVWEYNVRKLERRPCWAV